jgi:CheY-like chemotaxis protein
MPEMNGFRATATIRDQNSQVLNHAVPIVAMTASASHDDREECLRSGMNDYIAKPVTKEKLAEVCAVWLGCRSTARPQETAYPAEASIDAILTFFNEAEIMERLEDRLLVKSVLEEALQEMPILLQELQNMCAGDDCIIIRRHVHTLKGLAATISACQLRNCAQLVENAAQVSNIEIVRQLLPELERLVLKTVEAVSQSGHADQSAGETG